MAHSFVYSHFTYKRLRTLASFPPLSKNMVHSHFRLKHFWHFGSSLHPSYRQKIQSRDSGKKLGARQ